jgi:hypothetical protein
MAAKFIVYALTDPRSGEVRYIGKSCSGLKRPMHGTYSAHCASWIKSLLMQGMKYGIMVLGEFSNGVRLGDYERWAIAYARGLGWRLTNQTDGGGGLFNPSKDVRERLRTSHLGQKRSVETIDKWRTSIRGRKHSEETKKRMSEVRRAAYESMSNEEKKRRSDTAKRTNRSTEIEIRERISVSLTGRKQSKETILKRNTSNTGKKRSLESRARMSEAAKKRCEKYGPPCGIRKPDREEGMPCLPR